MRAEVRRRDVPAVTDEHGHTPSKTMFEVYLDGIKVRCDPEEALANHWADDINQQIAEPTTVVKTVASS